MGAEQDERGALVTLLMFSQFEDGVGIVTDTLVSDENRQPALYTSKVQIYAHLNMVTVVTGIQRLADVLGWSVARHEGLRDIDDANQITPDVLRAAYLEFKEHHAPHDVGTATAYAWGFPSGSDQVVFYRYSSEDDFKPVRSTKPRFAIKPPPQQFEWSAPETTEELIDLAARIRDENDNERTPGPVAIGGELYVTELFNWNITTRRIHRFEDFTETAARFPKVSYQSETISNR